MLKLAEDARSAEARNLVLNDCRWRLLVVLGRMEQGAHYGPEFAHPMRPAADQARVCAEG